YAFTDFKSQGQTLECVIVDIGKPPSGSLTGFNAYIALSRSRGRDTIRLLHNFDARLFPVHPNELLRTQDELLAVLESNIFSEISINENISTSRRRWRPCGPSRSP
ncbi:hypothetical protein EDB85DRAFT_1864625, partial [Lactarius pseudohatsudake]